VKYQRLSAAEKGQYHRDKMREPPMRCPACETSVQPEDMQAHQQRCQGRPAPHARSKWVTFQEALQLGAERKTLSRWVERGRVRIQGAKGQRRYLARDIAGQLASGRWRSANRGSNVLTKGRATYQSSGMVEPISEDVRTRLRALADSMGSAEAVARKMDISADTLRKAMAGTRVRRGTRVLIETQMEKIR
jgi:hypothetical protein